MRAMAGPHPSVCRIRVRGEFDSTWSEHIRGMKIERVEAGPPPVTLLTGELPDQAALDGVLNTLRLLELPVLEVQRASGAVGGKHGLILGEENSRRTR